MKAHRSLLAKVTNKNGQSERENAKQVSLINDRGKNKQIRLRVCVRVCVFASVEAKVAEEKQHINR